MQLNLLLVRLYKKLEKHKVVFVYIPLAAYWLLIFVLTTIPTDIVPQFFKPQDKFEHLFAYLVLAVLLSLTLHFQKKSRILAKNLVIVTLCLIMFYAAVDELHQLFIPGRVADILDWTADSIGGIIGILLGNFLIKKGAFSA